MLRMGHLTALAMLVLLTLATSATAEDRHERTASSVSVTVAAPGESRDRTATSVSVTTHSGASDDDDDRSRYTPQRDDDDRPYTGERREMSKTTALWMIAMVLGLLSAAGFIVYFSGASDPDGAAGSGNRRLPDAGLPARVEGSATFVCDCGREGKLPLSDLEGSTTCTGCGKVNRLTQASIAEVKAAAVEAYRAAAAAAGRGSATAVVDLTRG